MKKVVAYGRTDVGVKRSVNQDSILLNDDIQLYAVADGMGGHRGGEIASSTALEVLELAVRRISERKGSIKPIPFLKEAVTLASMKIYEKALMDNNLLGMGTTLVSLYIHDDKGYIAQVGDSRVYLFRDKNLWKITEDHSLVNEQLKSGLITKTQAEESFYKNVITRSVGFDEVVDVDIYMRDLDKGDLFLLCSDGLTSMLSDRDISDSINGEDLSGSVNKLINLANKAGGNDNISVILVKVR